MTENNQNTTSPSPFNNGLFVISLIVVFLILLILTWSISFVAMIFGAFGAICAAGTQRHFKPGSPAFRGVSCDENVPCDEKCAYFLARAVLGMVFGTAAYALAFGSSLSVVSGTLVAVVSFAVAFLVDHLLFAHQKR